MDRLIELAERLESMEDKIHGIIASDSGLSASGAATAIALVVTVNSDVLGKAAAALRARATKEQTND